MPIYIPRRQEFAESPPVLRPTMSEWESPYSYIQTLYRKFGASHGSVKVIPPDDWVPAYSPWRDDKVIRLPFKVQVLSQLNGENRQKTFREVQDRLVYFMSGDPQSKKGSVSSPPLRSIGSHFCPIISTPLPETVLPSWKDRIFWVYWPPLGVSCQTRITSSVLAPSVKYRRTLPFVTTEMIDPESGNTFTATLDEPDLCSTIVNGNTPESAKDCVSTELCQVCSVACGFSADTDSPAPAAQLDRMQTANPAVVCSGCGLIVHAKCVAATDWRDRALIEFIARSGWDWFCIECCSDPNRVGENSLHFGYDETEPITRREFERRARHHNSFRKSNLSDEENEFWTIINSPSNCNKSVLYGTDIDSAQISGGVFETDFGMDDDWNLRKLALNGDSLMQYLPGGASITGVSRPWLYLGSRYSAFSWHAEDHFLLSISYLHEGKPKIWYTVAEKYRERIEAAFRNLMPDIVAHNPDLHHQMITLIDPKTLYRQFQIPYGRLVQNPGEFIVTFPQAYHCGFNTGFNLAEAVNVAIPDWLPHGIESINCYRESNRRPVFCIEQLVWEAAVAIIEATKGGTLCPSKNLSRDVGMYCLDYLKTHVLAAIEKALAICCPIDMIRDNLCSEKEILVCSKCHQFCYFAACGEKVCLACTSKTSRRIWLRYSVETISKVISVLENCLPNLFTLRRSTRTGNKQPRLE